MVQGLCFIRDSIYFFFWSQILISFFAKTKGTNKIVYCLCTDSITRLFIVYCRNISRDTRIRHLLEKLGLIGKEIGSCLAPPKEEYVFPRDLYKY